MRNDAQLCLHKAFAPRVLQITSGSARNYRGWAEVISGTYSAGTRGNASYEVNYTRPLANSRIAFNLSAFQTTNDYSAFSSHIEILRGAIANYMVCIRICQGSWHGTHFVSRRSCFNLGFLK